MIANEIVGAVKIKALLNLAAKVDALCVAVDNADNLREISQMAAASDVKNLSVMVDVDYLVIAVRSLYRNSNDFEKIYKWLDIIYLTNRIQLELKGVLLIGY